jgi:hypothetical protein
MVIILPLASLYRIAGINYKFYLEGASLRLITERTAENPNNIEAGLSDYFGIRRKPSTEICVNAYYI